LTATVVTLPVPALLTEAERAQLVANGMASVSTDGFDPPPVVRLYSRSLRTVWYLTEMDPFGSSDLAFGLCDGGDGFADLAGVDLSEIARADDPHAFRRDPAFRPDGRLSDYLARARHPAFAAAG
jgi:hypothetical protein